MSYAYRVLQDWHYNDENGEGHRLYASLFNDEGDLKPHWRKSYINWLEELCEINQIPEGPFRDAWIQDALYEAQETDLDYIKKWFSVDETEILEFKDHTGKVQWRMTVADWQDTDHPGTEYKLVAFDSQGSQYELCVDYDDLKDFTPPQLPILISTCRDPKDSTSPQLPTPISTC